MYLDKEVLIKRHFKWIKMNCSKFQQSSILSKLKPEFNSGLWKIKQLYSFK